jgi:uncharacterized protein (TIGR02246 family)
MKESLHWINFVLVATVVGCAQGPATRADTLEADEAALRATVSDFLAAWNAADVASLGTFYAEDAIEMQPDGAPHEGRKAIQDGHGAFFAQFTATQTATVTEVGVEGNLGFNRGTWSVRSMPRAGGPETSRTGNWMVLLRRDADGSWKIWRWIWNEQPTAP